MSASTTVHDSRSTARTAAAAAVVESSTPAPHEGNTSAPPASSALSAPAHHNTFGVMIHGRGEAHSQRHACASCAPRKCEDLTLTHGRANSQAHTCGWAWEHRTGTSVVHDAGTGGRT